MTHTYAHLLYHFVWSTKERVPLIRDSFEHRLYEYIRSIAMTRKARVMTINGTPDHIHILTRLPVTTNIPDFVRDIKIGSTKWLNKDVQECKDFAWQEGYGVFSVGQYGQDKVVSYIENQKHHHKSMSFEEEYLSFLDALGIVYDPRFVLD